MQKVKIATGYYRSGYGRTSIRMATIYLINGKAYARDIATSRTEFYPLTGDLEGYIRVNFENNIFYQVTYDTDHKTYQNDNDDVVAWMLKECRIHLDKHGLTDWKVQLTNSKRAAGICSYRTRTIGLSPIVNKLRKREMVLDTILHEIAHALTPGHHHDNVWRMKAIELGCNGERCYNDVKVEGKYKATCPAGHVHYRHKAPHEHRRMSCGQCSKNFDEKYILNYEKHTK